MRLFGYYAWHSLINQIKKLFKTWVLIFFAACLVLGGLIGGGVAMLEDAADIEEEPVVDSEVVEQEDIDIVLDISGTDVIELIVGGILLVIFTFDILGADKSGSKIFQPADVNLLFASPMKPQSVLLFRLVTQMGMILFASAYSLFMLSGMLLDVGVSGWMVLLAVVTWLMTLVIGELVKLLLYTVCSTHIRLKKHLRTGVLGFVSLLVASFILYQKATGDSYLVAAAGFFNGPLSRLIPIWGWLKGMFMFAMEGNIALCLLCVAAILAGGAALVYIIWHMKADFYEDAMAKTEETAQLLAAAQSEKAGVTVIRRKKDRSDRLRRDGMRHGAGANVFFFKAMYNRFRFAHFGIFTKTSETYLVTAAAVAALCRFAIGTKELLPVILTLGVFVFYRSLGNPLAEDTQMDHFLLIPESTWRKLFWSLMGGTVNCLLDLLPAVIVAALLLGENLLLALAWLPLIVSVDFFATAVGAFIGQSVPVSAGKMIKQLVQILFIYFGLLPDIAIMAVGLTFGQPVIAAVGCTVANILLGLVFFALTPLFLEPKDGKKYVPQKPFAGKLEEAKKHFSKLGMGIFVILVVGTVAQILVMGVMEFVWPQWAEHSWGMWLATFAPLYLIAVPIGLLILRKVPAKPLEKRSMKPGSFVITAIICVFMMYAGNLLGTVITVLLQLLPGIVAENPIMSYATDDSVVAKVLFMVIFAPVIEEYIFRKQLIDRMHIYGEKLAVVTSALMFGLFHGNLSQMFYAFTLGLVFGYVYLKTGKLRYSVILHMGINFLGSVVGPLFIEKLAVLETIDTQDLAAYLPILPWLLGYLAYALALIGFAIAGLVLLCIYKRRISYAQAELELPEGSRFKTVYLNTGMLLLIISCLAMILLSVISL